ncbi:MAG: tRNA (adenosine(37)-N6)-threonylcarbamoyltransferase complex dimerization subunit type 1 TsaB [Zoogloeaceae bacterium]|jgi:tRNA threonylcarbamoyladenosine biosynthesis protein TsaB|nr:tRNA (adenosine(37)-N6)-threonylcarbamoyltransferase complex dimerization subunit type 1 TsaB [Zoogloeaceae bacterium]
MRILALETSTDAASCALWQDGRLTGVDCPAGRPQSETLLPLARQLLAEAGCGFRDLSAIAFDCGPGAFTSLRVGCGLAQGIACALDLPLLPVGSLEAMAQAAEAPRVLSLLDARMGEVYAAAFERLSDGRLQAVMPARVARPEALEFPEDESWLAVGNALAAYPALSLRFAAPFQRPEILPHACALAELGAYALQRGEQLDPAAAGLRYVRDKVAQTTAERQAAGGRV